MVQDWWCSFLKQSRLTLLGLKVSLLAVTLPAPTPHIQRMKSHASLVFPCVASNSKAAAVTIGISFNGLVFPTSMIVSTSQGAPKNEVDPGYVTAPYSVGASIACRAHGNNLYGYEG